MNRCVWLIYALCIICLFPSLLPARGNIKGFIKDTANGETLPYVNVVIEGTSLGDVSDENGYYVITSVPPGHYTVKAMLIGYEAATQSVTILRNQTVTIDFHLTQTTLELPEIVKTAARERFERQIEMSTVQLTPRELKAPPALIETDLFRTLQSLPGVNARTDFSSALYIRGGNPSENIILLDDVRIYNPYHLGGVFSTFNTDAIKNVDFSVGGFPARYGNAISSVISITNRDGNSKEFAARGSVSLLSSRLTIENPIPNGSFLLSFRRTYFDVLYNRFIRPYAGNFNDRFPYYFYDYHGKINYNISPNSKITLSGFNGDDVVHLVDESYEWDPTTNNPIMHEDYTDIRFGNRSTTLKWRYIFNPKLFSEFILARSRFRTLIETTHEFDAVDANDEIQDYTLKTDMTYYWSDAHELRMGIEAQWLAFTLLFKVENFEWLAYNGNKSRHTDFYSAYIQDDWKISPFLNIQGGIRLTYYELGQYVRADPRISLRYRLQDNINIKFSTGVFHQYFYTFNPEDFDYIRLVDLWFPIDQRYPPIRADHYIGGLEYWINDTYTFSIEGYYKDYRHLLDMNELGRADVNVDDFLRGEGYATGMELLLRKQRGKLIGWLGYSLAYAERTIESPRPSNRLLHTKYNVEYRTFVPNYDRRHSLKAVLSYQKSSKWKFSASLNYGSGLPETPTIGWKRMYSISPDGDISGLYSKQPIKAPKNSYRLPPYFRVDLSASRTFSFTSWAMELFFQIINVTNHKNIFMYNYDLAPVSFQDNGNPIYLPAQRRGVRMFPIIPTFGINFNF